MIRTFINLTATCTVGLVVLMFGLGAWNAGSHGLSAVAGSWNRGVAATSTPVPIYAPGVTVVGQPTAVAPAPVAPPADAPPTATPMQAECDWATSTLALDARLDDAAATAMPQWADHYRQSAHDWRTIAAWISANCALRTWGHQTCTDSRNWLESGRLSHVSDEQSDHPYASPEWNEQWENTYERLEKLIGVLCGG